MNLLIGGTHYAFLTTRTSCDLESNNMLSDMHHVALLSVKNACFVKQKKEVLSTLVNVLFLKNVSIGFAKGQNFNYTIP